MVVVSVEPSLLRSTREAFPDLADNVIVAIANVQAKVGVGQLDRLLVTSGNVPETVVALRAVGVVKLGGASDNLVTVPLGEGSTVLGNAREGDTLLKNGVCIVSSQVPNHVRSRFHTLLESPI